MKALRGIGVIILLFIAVSGYGQRHMENLDHGLLAVYTGNGNFISWRVLSSEYEDVAYSLYREGTKLNSVPISGASNFTDEAGAAGMSYELRTVIGGEEKLIEESTIAWANSYLDIPVRELSGNTVAYELNDASVGDLDGDGEYEIVVKRLALNDNAVDATDYHYLEAYELDGTFMWAINIGPNINDDVEFNFLVWDFDGDGKAEVATRTSEGTVDGLGNQIGDVDGDGVTNYRYAISYYGYRTEGPDFLSIFNGETGEEITRANYIERDPIVQWGEWNHNITQLSHRATKCMFTVAYLDGKNPSVVISRGIYHKVALEAWNFDGSELTQLWHFASDQSGNSDYYGQGYHNLTQGDVDNDGRDEVMYGSMCVDDDGSGLYSTNLGHGDAQHLADINPDIEGLEYFGCLENSPVYGGNYRNAGTGEIYYHKGIGRDMGRAGCSDITATYPGMEMWGPTGFPFLTSEGKEIGALNPPGTMNFYVWWDGDLLRELLDHAWTEPHGIGQITKYNNGSINLLLKANGTYSNNWTKGTPCVSADILGDWREEVVWRRTDNKALRIYTTINPTEHRIYTLMHDPQYRAAIGWQPNSYNQPPHPSVFIGYDLDTLRPAPIMQPGQKVYQDGTWDLNNSLSWVRGGINGDFSDGDSVLFDVSGNNSSPVNISGTLNPADVRVISSGNYEFSGEGNIAGTTNMVKSGKGRLIISNENTYTGLTRIWQGELSLRGSIASEVLVKRFARLSGNGTIYNTLNLEELADLIVSDSEGDADTLFISDDLNIAGRNQVFFDLSNNPAGNNDHIQLGGNLNILGETSLVINLLDGELPVGKYILVNFGGTFTGDISLLKTEGIAYLAHILYEEDGKLILEVPETRMATKISWTGSIDNEWDLYNKQNWLNNGVSDVFIVGDTVVFDDMAEETDIQVMANYNIGQLLFESSKDISINGDGYLEGEASLVKRGSGKLSINTLNTFTGPTRIEEGVLELSKLYDGGEASAIGASGNGPENLVIDGGRMLISGPGTTFSDRGMTMGSANGALVIEDPDANLILESALTGEGYLVKEGEGMLTVGSGTHSGSIIKEGVLKLLNEDANVVGPGEEIIFEGGSLEMYNNLNTATENCSWNIIVEEEMTGKLLLDGRCSLTGSLSGAGDLQLYIPWVKSEFSGDWSAFEGIIRTSTDNDGGIFIVGNSAGMGSADLVLGEEVSMIYRESEDAIIEIGSLAGAESSILGAGGESINTISWRIGTNNKNTVFDGLINNDQYLGSGASAALIKAGTGSLTLTNANTYSGGTIIEEGILVLSNTSGSATGSGDLRCEAGGTISGNGSMSGNLIIEDDGSIMPGYSGMDVFTVEGNLDFSPASIFMADLDPAQGLNDRINVGGSVTLDGILLLSNMSVESYELGDAFQIFDVEGSISGSFSNIYPRYPGEGLYWDTSTLRTQGFLRITDEVSVTNATALNHIETYPNPFNEELTLKLPVQVNEENIHIFTLDGREIVVEKRQKDHKNWLLNTKHLENGSYILFVQTADGRSFRAVIIKK